MTGRLDVGVENTLLLALHEPDRAFVLSHAERVALRRRQTLIEPYTSIRHVYFIEGGQASLLSRPGDGEPIEVGVVGRRGFVGAPVLLGCDRSPYRCLMQIPGAAWRIPTPHFEAALQRVSDLRRLLLRYLQRRMTLQSQLIVCNTRHSLRQRLARWLLMALDRGDGDVILATHGLIARMLAVRRAGVTVAMGELEAAGVIRSARGRYRVLDRGALEAASCGCYAFLRSEYAMIGDAGARS